jgi:hypothetical protein
MHAVKVSMKILEWEKEGIYTFSECGSVRRWLCKFLEAIFGGGGLRGIPSHPPSTISLKERFSLIRPRIAPLSTKRTLFESINDHGRRHSSISTTSMVPAFRTNTSGLVNFQRGMLDA